MPFLALERAGNSLIVLNLLDGGDYIGKQPTAADP